MKKVHCKGELQILRKHCLEMRCWRNLTKVSFESIIEKVIVGGYDENGEKDPYKITFIYKTGFTNGIGNAKKRFGKSAGVGEKAKKMCSDVSDKVKYVYSNISDNTRGDSGIIVQT